MSDTNLPQRPGGPAVRETVVIQLDGRALQVPGGGSVAAALLSADVTAFRKSVSGEPRAPVCGMGICFECRLTIDGTPHQRSCLVQVRDGMTIETGANA